MGTSNSKTPEPAVEPKAEDGDPLEPVKLCSFCDDMCNVRLQKSGEPFWERPLSELVETAKTCRYCALWMQSLEASAKAVGEKGELLAPKLHPLLQTAYKPEDVTLQYIQMHGVFDGNIQQKLIWPHLGTIWASLEMVPAMAGRMLNLGPLSVSDQTDLIWKGIEFWLNECTTKHTECRCERDLTWKPSRLLQLDAKDEALTVRLVEGHDIPSGVEYLTLSHCWGDSIPLRLTTQTHDQFKSQIPLEDLPKTFKEACEATKRLGHKYLWIDSLCIIQDDLEDWATESAAMSFIYGNSFLNLAAAAASDGQHGLFDASKERDREAWMPLHVRKCQGGPFSGDFYVCNYRDWWNKLHNAPVNRRAWVLQERTLAPRVLYFGLEQVAFECPHMIACERLPFGDIARMDGDMTGLWTKIKGFIAAARRGEKVAEFSEFLARWNDVVRSYSQGKLTVETDKMVALGAIADTFALAIGSSKDSGSESDGEDAKATEKSEEQAPTPPKLSEELGSGEDIFVAGLWKPDMALQLAWRATSQVMSQQISGKAPWAHGSRPSEYIAPSWSWCSVKDVLIEPQQANPFDIGFAKVLDVNINHVPGFKESEGSNGLKYCCAPGSSLRLQCSLLPVAGFGNFGKIIVPKFGETDEGPIELDTKNFWDVAFEEEATKAEMPCVVPISVDMIRVNRAISGLILDLRHDEGEDGKKYLVRLGAFTLDEDIKKFWDAIERFDSAQPETDVFDGVYRPKEGEREYEKKDGVMQRVCEIR